ncbi:MAG: class I SAM-dependent methyltransferase [Moraxellaceae bacterium]|nr:class I SAM-dependent methyltransferase [Moraxellaceae bacterium]MDZ4386978.1 class I SAM-dependent methyltransferase [Moraxellaceae bacterium]
MENNNDKPEQISPTAYYTGAVWLQHHLSHPAFKTWQGRVFYNALRLPMALSRTLKGPTMESFLLARHSIIDKQLHAAINSGKVTQIIEIAAGISPRGWRFCKQYGSKINYIEADLPGMAAHKQQLLEKGGLLRDNHQVVAINALSDSGEDSLQHLVSSLDKQHGIAIITEGLINYFDTETVTGMWARFAQAIKPFPYALYLSDIHLGTLGNLPASKTFVNMLSRFVRGRVHLHFDSEAMAEIALKKAGFHQAKLWSPRQFADALPACRVRGANLVRVIQADLHAH